MKKVLFLLCSTVLFFVFVGTAIAGLEIIGTATYGGGTYNLIYEDDSPSGGLVWLDYTSSSTATTWDIQNAWAKEIGGSLTVNLDPGYTTTIDWSVGWRLPVTQVELDGYGNDTSDMGHLFHVSLGGSGWPWDSDCPFSNLLVHHYWSGTESSEYPGRYWGLTFGNGGQWFYPSNYSYYALAVRPGTVSGGSIPSGFSVAYGSISANPNYNSSCDFDNDGDVDGSDLAEFASLI